MGSANEQIADGVTTHAVNILRVAASLRQEVLDNLRQLEGKLVADLNAPATITAFQRGRLEALLRQTRASIQASYDAIAELSINRLGEVANVAQAKTNQIVNNAFQVEVMTVAQTPQQLETMAGDRLLSGRFQHEWWGKQAADLRDRFTVLVRTGIEKGQGIDAIVRGVRGTANNNYNDGIMGISRANAEALVRTSVQDITNAARLKSYEANQDVIKAVQWRSTLDSRTTKICIALDGKQWSLPDYEPIAHDVSFPGPTAHWNCRSTQLPVTRSWDELKGPKGVVPPKGPPKPLGDLLRQKLEAMGMSEKQIEAAVARQRVAVNGEVAEPETFDEFLRRKDVAFQNDLLGVQKAQLWREGKITLTDLIDQNHRPLTVPELQDLVRHNADLAAKKYVEGENGIGLVERGLLEESMVYGSANRAVMTHFVNMDTGERITITGISPSAADMDKIAQWGDAPVGVLRNSLTRSEVFTPQEINLFGKIPNWTAARLVNPNGKVFSIELRDGFDFGPDEAKAVNERYAALETTGVNDTARLRAALRDTNSGVRTTTTPENAVLPRRNAYTPDAPKVAAPQPFHDPQAVAATAQAEAAAAKEALAAEQAKRQEAEAAAAAAARPLEADAAKALLAETQPPPLLARDAVGSLGGPHTATAIEFTALGHTIAKSDFGTNTMDLYNKLFALPAKVFTDTITEGLGLTGKTELYMRALNESDLYVKLTVDTPKGYVVIARQFNAERQTVLHDFFGVPKAYQGTGLAKQVTANFVRLYDHAGVKTIEIHANLDVGGYAWARYGFLPATSGDWRIIQSHVAARMAGLQFQLPPAVRAEVQRLATSSNPEHLRDLAALTYPVQVPVNFDDKVTMPLGKALLLDSDWYGRLDLSDALAYTYLKRYISGGK